MALVRFKVDVALSRAQMLIVSRSGRLVTLDLSSHNKYSIPGGLISGQGISVQKPTSSQRPRREANLKLLNRRGVDLSTQEVLEVVDNSGNKAGRNGWVVQRYIERPLLVQGRKFDVRMFVLLVADPSTRSWRRRSKSTPPSCTKNHISTADGQFLEEPEGPQTEESPSIERGSARGKQREVGPSPLTAWCHRDAYVRMSSVKYSNDPEKAKDRVRACRRI